jgi:hypothetical protein
MGEEVPMGELEYDSTAYDMIHFMKVEWPCLSFDVIADALGSNRQRVRHSLDFIFSTARPQTRSDATGLRLAYAWERTVFSDRCECS